MTHTKRNKIQSSKFLSTDPITSNEIISPNNLPEQARQDHVYDPFEDDGLNLAYEGESEAEAAQCK